MKKILVGMSGGVDSSVAALLLQEQGYEVAGVTLKLWEPPESGHGESTPFSNHVKDAQAVCRRLGIPHYVFDYREMFQKEVIEPFVRTYERGLTPNPCVICNQKIKFARLLEQADDMGFDGIATGHYSTIIFDQDSGRYLLRRGVNPAKDQSYVLYGLTQAQLARTLAPLGRYGKEEIRAMAQKNHLPVFDKPDSQDICFVPEGDHLAFMRDYRGEAPAQGDFVDARGHVLGRHKGLYAYTIGQRKGLGLSLGRPAFVSAMDGATGCITLTFDEGELYARRLVVRQVNWISVDGLREPVEAQVKIRYAHQAAEAILRPLPPEQGGGVEVEFTQPQRAITAGQAAVFYQGDVVMGGGQIEK